MKKNILGFAAIMAFAFTLSMTSCSSADKPAEEATTEEATDGTEAAATEEVHAHAHYKCPMDCEKGKEYEEAGTCPVCKMELAEVKTEG